MTYERNISKTLDLRGTPCPLNFIQCRLAMERLANNDILHVTLDCGEPEEMVIPSLKDAGHHIEIIQRDSKFVQFLVMACAQ